MAVVLTLASLEETVLFPDLFEPSNEGLAVYTRSLLSSSEQVIEFAGVFDTFAQSSLDRLAEQGAITDDAAAALRDDVAEVIQLMLTSKSDLSGRVEELPDDLDASARVFGKVSIKTGYVIVLLMIAYLVLAIIGNTLDYSESVALSMQLVMARAFMTALGQREQISYRMDTNNVMALGAPREETFPQYISADGESVFDSGKFLPPMPEFRVEEDETGITDQPERALLAAEDTGTVVSTPVGPAGGEIVVPEAVLGHLWRYASFYGAEEEERRKVEENRPLYERALAGVSGKQREWTAFASESARRLGGPIERALGVTETVVNMQYFLERAMEENPTLGTVVRYSDYYVELGTGWKISDYVGAQILLNARQYDSTQGAGIGNVVNAELPWESLDFNHKCYLIYHAVAADHPELRLMYLAHSDLERRNVDRRSTERGRDVERYLTTLVARGVLGEIKRGVALLAISAIGWAAKEILLPPIKVAVFPTRGFKRGRRLGGQAMASQNMSSETIAQALKEANGDKRAAAARLLGRE